MQRVLYPSRTAMHSGASATLNGDETRALLLQGDQVVCATKAHTRHISAIIWGPRKDDGVCSRTVMRG